MSMLIAGLVIFLGLHSVRIVADSRRTNLIATLGENKWKALYSALSIVGFGLIVFGYGQSRLDPTVLWHPPIWTRHLAALLTLPAFILLAAAYIPKNAIKARLGHPMLLGTKLWATAHLLANGNLADVLLFGGFLLWAALCFRAAKKRDRASGVRTVSAGAVPTITAVVAGVLGWAAFAFYLHTVLIGVKPFA